MSIADRLDNEIASTRQLLHIGIDDPILAIQLRSLLMAVDEYRITYPPTTTPRIPAVPSRRSRLNWSVE